MITRHIEAYSACHPSGVGWWIPAKAEEYCCISCQFATIRGELKIIKRAYHAMH